MPEPILKSIRQTKVGWFLSQDRFPTDSYPLPNSHPSVHEERVPQIFSNGSGGHSGSGEAGDRDPVTPIVAGRSRLANVARSVPGWL